MIRIPETWTAEREGLVAQRVQRNLVQRRRAARGLVVAGAVAVAVLCVLALRPSSAGLDPFVRFGDGSTALPMAEAKLVTVEDRTDAVTVRLDHGSASFDVTKRPGRKFHVEVPPVVVEVVGTQFTVARDEAHARVYVTEGHVAVFGADGQRAELTTGQHGEFPLAVAPVAAPVPEPVEAPAKPDWRPLANRGEFEHAFDAMKRGAVRDEPKELLLASDVARLSGHPEQARAYLQQLLDRHGRDPRAPLAAFTLGRVLLDELGWPKDAAKAFAKARALEPNGPLAEDALAREVEAWARAGETDEARAAAQGYLARYPNGQRAASVRRHGGL